MTREEALAECLNYLDGEWDVEALDLSDPEFKQAMMDCGLIYERKDGTILRRGKNGIFTYDREGNKIPGMSEFDMNKYVELGFSEAFNMKGIKFLLEKMPGDQAARLVDVEKQMICGFVSPTRDTRAHWMHIPGDDRTVVMSMTTQLPGKTSLLQNVWVKGVDNKNPKKQDFYHRDVSQRVLSSKCVEVAYNKLKSVTRAKAFEFDYNSLTKWKEAKFTTQITIKDDLVFDVMKKANDNHAHISLNGEPFADAYDSVSETFRHFTKCVICDSAQQDLDVVGRENVKLMVEAVYKIMMNPPTDNGGLKKTPKRLQEKKSSEIKSLADLPGGTTVEQVSEVKTTEEVKAVETVAQEQTAEQPEA